MLDLGVTSTLHTPSIRYSRASNILISTWGAPLDPETRLGKTGNYRIIKLLLAKSPDVNARNDEGRTALMEAAANGHLEVVNALLAANADIHVKSNAGRTALMQAAYFGQTKIVEVLLDKGASVSEKDKDGYAAADFASSGKHGDIVDLLSKAKAKQR